MAFQSKTHLPAPLWVAKLLLLPLLLLASTFLTFNSILPFAKATLPSLRAALRTYIAPPYLFVAINLIILVIWKLSDKPNAQSTYKPKTPPPIHHFKPEEPPSCPSPAPPFPVSKSSAHPPPLTKLSPCDEEEEEEKEEECAALSLDATWRKITKATREMRRSESVRETRRLEPTPAPEMRKSETFHKARPPAMDNDELNRLFEAFIKKEKDQMRKLRRNY